MSDPDHKDYELDGRFGRCKVCADGKASWTRLGNLRSHLKQKTHKENVVRFLSRANEDSARGASDKRARQTYVEDCEDEDTPRPSVTEAAIPWFSAPTCDENTFPAAASARENSGREPVDVPDIPLDMQDALSGAVDFSSGDAFRPSGTSDITLEDVLSGAGLLETAFMEATEDERPPPPSETDSGWAAADELSAPDRPVPSAEELSKTMFGSSAPSANIFPYPNGGMLKSDILFSSPTIRFSRSQKEAILAWGKEMGAKDVPSLYGLEKFQAEALECVGDPTEKVSAPSGNVFYVNSIHQALARDYAHEDKRRKMHLFPEFTGARVKETWQASKWLVDAPDDVLTPMTRIRGKDYYVNELTYCADQSWCIPTRFFEFEGVLWAKVRKATETENGLVVSDRASAIPCSFFQSPWPEVQHRTKGQNIFAPESSQFADAMPHPDRERAGGLEFECPPLVVFIDDVSGNTSKQWNVHYSCYVSNAALPRAELEKDGNIRFVATSPHASPMEIIRAICEALKKAEATPYKVWDAVKRRHVLIRPWILFLPGDNPMQAELCSHIGLQANFFCRACHCGGDQQFKASNEGFASLMTGARARTVSDTRDAIATQLVAATHASAEKPLKNLITTSGVKDSFAMPVLNQLIAKGKVLRRSTPNRKALSPEQVNKELYEDLMKKSDVPLRNPLLDMPGLDVHQDTPVEPLHTHLLGVVKYFWAQTVWVLEKSGKFAEFQGRLNSLSRDGLKIPNIMADYMCRYQGALIGKHFKTISQVMAFAICGLVESTLQNAWVTIGHLTTLIWETEIVDIEAYTKELRIVIQETMDFAADLSPGLLTEKHKFHILVHLPDHIKRFGPALLFSTERYESFNHIFRLCSIHSNRQAPSRDIAKTFANQDRCRHMLSGGYWKDKTTGDWVQAGRDVLRHVSDHAIDARLLGLTAEKRAKPGAMTLLPLPPRQRGKPIPQHPVVSWAQTESSRLLPSLPTIPGQWNRAASVVTLNGDTAAVGSEVLIKPLESEHAAISTHTTASACSTPPTTVTGGGSHTALAVLSARSPPVAADAAPPSRVPPGSAYPTAALGGPAHSTPAASVACASDAPSALHMPATPMEAFVPSHAATLSADAHTAHSSARAAVSSDHAHAAHSALSPRAAALSAPSLPASGTPMQPVDRATAVATDSFQAPTTGAVAGSTDSSQLVFASVIEILQATSPRGSRSWVLVRESQLEPHAHTSLNMPVIRRTGQIRIIPPEAIVGAVNVQHDCSAGRCTVSKTQRLRQEREESTRTRKTVKHSDSVQYVVNLAALHNQSLLRQNLPATLCARPSAFADRPGLHKRAAESLRDTKLQKKLAREALIRKSAEKALRASVSNAAGGDILGLADGSTAGQTDEAEPATGADEPAQAALPAEPAADVSMAAPRGPRQKKSAPKRKATTTLAGTAANHAPATSGIPAGAVGGVKGVAGCTAFNIGLEGTGTQPEAATSTCTVPFLRTGVAAGEERTMAARSELPPVSRVLQVPGAVGTDSTTPTSRDVLESCRANGLSTSGTGPPTRDEPIAPAGPAPKRPRVRAQADPLASAAREADLRAMFR